MTKSILLSLAVFLILLSSCQKKDSPLPDDDSYDVFVINEGNFTAGNGNLTAYNSSTQNWLSSPIEDANVNNTLGDVPQSAYSIGDDVWIPINASNQILIIDPLTFKIKEQIQDIQSPKFGCRYGSKFYIGGLFHNTIYQIDIHTKGVNRIQAPASSNIDMVAKDGKIFFVSSDTSNNKLFILDTISSSISSEVELNNAYGPSDIAELGEDLYILSGLLYWGIPYRLTQVSGATATTYDLPSGEYKSLDTYNNELYILANEYAGSGGLNGVYKVDAGASNVQLNSIVKVPQDVTTFYTFGIDPSSGEIYCGDAKSYTVNGEVYRFSSTGNFIHKFDCGLIPGYFLFR